MGDVFLLDGVTYPLKEPLKDLGFRWTTDFNNMGGAVRAHTPPPRPLRPVPARPPIVPASCHRPHPCARAPQNHWVRPADGFDVESVVSLFDEWGWNVTVFDGVDDEADE